VVNLVNEQLGSRLIFQAGAQRYGFTICSTNFVDNGIRTSLIASIVDDCLRTGLGQTQCDSGANALRGARDHRDFVT
jgi:hypothetical protein